MYETRKQKKINSRSTETRVVYARDTIIILMTVICIFIGRSEYIKIKQEMRNCAGSLARPRTSRESVARPHRLQPFTLQPPLRLYAVYACIHISMYNTL